MDFATKAPRRRTVKGHERVSLRGNWCPRAKKTLLPVKYFPTLSRLPIYNSLKVRLSQKKPNIIQTVTSYGKQLLGFIRQRVNTDEDAEDILQDVWYQLSTVPEIEAIEQMSSWLYRVARNRIIDKYRKQKPESLEDFGYED